MRQEPTCQADAVFNQTRPCTTMNNWLLCVHASGMAAGNACDVLLAHIAGRSAARVV
jgi:hypothetical protein